MKRKEFFPILTLVALLIVSTALAAAPATDSAADTAYDDGWQDGDNGGTGLQGWFFQVAAQGNAGFFVGTSTNNGDGDSNGDGDIDTNGRAWGLWANSLGSAEARRFLNSPLAVGEELKIQMDNGWVNTGSRVQFQLLNSGNAMLFQVEFLGGGPSNYWVEDRSGAARDTGVGFTDEGLTIQFSLTDADSYSVTLTRLDGGGNATLTGDLIDWGSGIDVSKINLKNANAGEFSQRDLFFNDIVVSQPTAVELVSLQRHAAPQRHPPGLGDGHRAGQPGVQRLPRRVAGGRAAAPERQPHPRPGARLARRRRVHLARRDGAAGNHLLLLA